MNGDVGGCEDGFTAVVAEDANGEQGVTFHFRENVGGAGHHGQMQDWEVSSVCGLDALSIGQLHRDGIACQ